MCGHGTVHVYLCIYFNMHVYSHIIVHHLICSIILANVIHWLTQCHHQCQQCSKLLATKKLL